MAERRAWFALWRVPGVGPKTFARLVDSFGDPAAALDASTRRLADAGIAPQVTEGMRSPDWLAADRDEEWASKPDHHAYLLTDPDYPALLREIPDPPPVLFVRGKCEALSSPHLAIVGSRNPTSGGRDTAFEFSRHLARMGFTICSGLALGIDAQAHRGALEAGGTTVAVIGTGPDRIYPARHLQLGEAILERGAVVSEFPPGTPAKPAHFPRRNRIISGLALGTLVVEAGLQSGSLITARLAAEQGREVFAVPGSIHNPLAKGCHALIRQGAKLVESAEHILEELPPPVDPGPPRETPNFQPQWDGEYARLLDALGYDPTPLDVLLQRTGLTPDALSSMLLMLELHGCVTASPGGRYARVGKRT